MASMPFEALKQIFIVIPALILAEGFRMLKGMLTEKNAFWRAVYVLFVALVFMIILLFMVGFR